jgi:hypothetical protein
LSYPIYSKILNGIKETFEVLSPVTTNTCEFYCGAEPYAVVEGDTKICKTCLGRYSNLFKKSDIRLIS